MPWSKNCNDLSHSQLTCDLDTAMINCYRDISPPSLLLSSPSSLSLCTVTSHLSEVAGCKIFNRHILTHSSCRKRLLEKFILKHYQEWTCKQVVSTYVEALVGTFNKEKTLMSTFSENYPTTANIVKHQTCLAPQWAAVAPGVCCAGLRAPCYCSGRWRDAPPHRQLPEYAGADTAVELDTEISQSWRRSPLRPSHLVEIVY